MTTTSENISSIFPWKPGAESNGCTVETSMANLISNGPLGVPHWGGEARQNQAVYGNNELRRSIQLLESNKNVKITFLKTKRPSHKKNNL